MKVKKNDTVLVITGKDAGKTAKVLAAMPKDNRIIVDGVNVQKKHKKARSAQEVSSIQNQSGPIDASNVKVVCPACGKAVRVKYSVVDGKKARVCACGAVLDKAYSKKAAAKAAAAAEEAPKKRTRKRAAKPAEAPATEVETKEND